MKTFLTLLVIALILGCKINNSASPEIEVKFIDTPPERSNYYEEFYDSTNYLVVGGDLRRKDEFRKIFETKKSKTLPSYMQLKKNKGTLVNKDGSIYSLDGYINMYSYLAKSGDREVEDYLLKFFKEYIDLALSQYSGKNGVIDILMKQTLNKIPPSLEKIDLLLSFFGVEPNPIKDDSDMIDIYGDSYTFMLLIQNIDEQYWNGKYLDMAWHPEIATKNRHEIEKLYENIKNGKVPLINREKWKRRIM